MIAFHGQQEIKDRYLARVTAHAQADEIIHGIYWENGKGCAVGCTVHSKYHGAYETELGIPHLLAYLEDRIFEGMGNGDAKEFPARFLSAIRVGADLSLVWPRFAVWLLVDPVNGVLRFARKHSTQWVAINRVADLYRELKHWDKRDKRAFKDAYAAYAANAANAAYAAYAAYAAAAARRTAYRAQADKLIELLAEAQPAA